MITKCTVLVFVIAAFITTAPAARAAPYDQTNANASWRPAHSLFVPWKISRPRVGRYGPAVIAASRVPDHWRPFAACVLKRESGGNLVNTLSGSGARNPASSAQGRWQFLDRLWRESLAGQVASRLRQHGMPVGVSYRSRNWMRQHQIADWPGVLQDVGFVEVLARGGSSHWRLRGSRCEKSR
jgi:hypothetical protein